ncbi:hypothetical protein NPIL_262621 [Nephila pilipes]|uniref:Uncharacterized protein n=1 Tax=Nephila pilipes TaxID=299642 RepID=A0A8X6U1H0_NEPPI|nr:hypothetical protein NPIL_262621 [Nephila pilipes]
MKLSLVKDSQTALIDGEHEANLYFHSPDANSRIESLIVWKQKWRLMNFNDDFWRNQHKPPEHIISAASPPK